MWHSLSLLEMFTRRGSSCIHKLLSVSSSASSSPITKECDDAEGVVEEEIEGDRSARVSDTDDD